MKQKAKPATDFCECGGYLVLEESGATWKFRCQNCRAVTEYTDKQVEK